MARARQHRFSGPVTAFQERRLPECATLAGYAALIEALGLVVPLPRTLSATGSRHKVYTTDGWRILTPRHAPEPTLAGHLTFALRYEGLDLAVLKRLFLAVRPAEITAIVAASPTGKTARRLWFLYEWILDKRLELPDAKRGGYVPAIDADLQYAIPGFNSPRHRVRNNLPGTAAFCPLVFRTAALDRAVALDLAARARALVADVPRDVLARAAAFLLVKDSRSSYAIEGERPAQDRIQRWGRAIGEAGRNALDRNELDRLQRIVIGDSRFVNLGLRTEGGFVGEHDRSTRQPLPDHIDAKPNDLDSLMGGLLAFEADAAQRLDPVMAAAILAFGFVYIHPYEDGNGRLHRFLIHHVLGRRGFNPPGVVFPVSSAILEAITDYKAVLEDYSARLLPVIQWRATPRGNVDVLNDTADFYRYFDATRQAEFLYGCVERTIETDLPQETAFLAAYDAFSARVQNVVDMPDRTVDLLFRFLHQQGGTLSRRARSKEFAVLSDAEAATIQEAYRDTLGALPAVRLDDDAGD